ncbi:MAG: hypothetical protein K2X74_18365 [Acetobacteraceae bacterium]|nr:hypothetical protein [Acetobacteraceae bacterium]
MRIEPRLLRRHLHEAAVEQLASRLAGDGYDVEREPSADQARRADFDLIARRGSETVFYEVKVLGEDAAPAAKRLGVLSAKARELGGRFKLVVIRPNREVDVEVQGIEGALREALNNDPTGQLGELGSRIEVSQVDGVEIEQLRVLPGRRTRAVGRAIASIQHYAEGGSLHFASSDVPFGFDVALDAEGQVGDDPPPRFELDLSDWVGERDEDSD